MPYSRNTNLSHLLQKNAKVAPNLYSADGERYKFKDSMMSQNKLKQIHTQTNKTIHAHKKSEYSESLQYAKKVIEQTCSLLLKHTGINTEEYQPKKNRHIEWGLEKLIRECETNDILDGALCTELFLIKDWRNNLEHTNDDLVVKSFSSQGVETIRKLYIEASKTLKLKPIMHWPDNLESGIGNILPFSPEGISMVDEQLIIQGPDGQRVCIDFMNDGATWTDKNGNKKFYKGNIAERNTNKGWIG